jgi:hypothetical protein
MNKTLSTTLTVIAILAVAGVIFFAGTMYSRANAFGPSMMGGYGWNNDNAYGPSMMTNGGNVMKGYRYNNTNLTPLTVNQAKASAEKYLANLNNSDLQIAETMIFDNNAYVVIKETGTGNGAFELLVDPISQIAYPEHGPNMMWNLKYSGLNHQYMMAGNGGMMGNGGMTLAPGAHLPWRAVPGSAGVSGYGWDSNTPDDVSGEMTVTSEQAIEYAQKYLDANISGATAATDPVRFYGYYTLDFEKDGKVAGMLSVNGYSSQVFLHTWHGAFIEESAIQ